MYTSFDPDQAVGTVLDQRCAIKGIQRKAGTYTYVIVNVTTDRSVTLAGLDQNSAEDSYTISDSEGNKFVLASTANLLTGTTALRFRAYNIGKVEVLPNTITVPVTIILGVVSVNNPSGPIEQGINEETDAELRERRKRSIYLGSQGYRESLIAELLNIPDVTYAQVYENDSNITDADGIPGHSIWTIVQGGTDKDVAYAIYDKRNAGCGMKGSTTYTITRSDGSTFVVAWDRPSTTDAYIKFDLTKVVAHTIDTNAIKSALVNANIGIYQPLDINTVSTIVKSVDSDVIVTDCQVSTDGTNWYDIIYPTTKKDMLSITTSRITINEL